ncbi:MAG TPA: YbhB/YbcL family Raf kinase inhibitor-like protein [Terracidiphilus sp.]|jgi:Raf kinase inhibitor-like YbhB/YbcL family protein
MDAFGKGAEIPKMYTCSGNDVSSAVSWKVTPRNTQSLALILDDPDAPGGTWTHWVIWDIPADAGGLTESVPTRERFWRMERAKAKTASAAWAMRDHARIPAKHTATSSGSMGWTKHLS